MNIKEIANPTPEQTEQVNSKLREFNQQANPVFWEKFNRDAYKAYHLNLFSFDEDDNINGGLFGTIQMKWIKVKIMTVSKEQRGNGIGTSLLKRAEEIAKAKGCSYVYLDTMEYQGADFYIKQDYKVVGSLEDWDSHGNSKFFMVKKL